MYLLDSCLYIISKLTSQWGFWFWQGIWVFMGLWFYVAHISGWKGLLERGDFFLFLFFFVAWYGWHFWLLCCFGFWKEKKSEWFLNTILLFWKLIHTHFLFLSNVVEWSFVNKLQIVGPINKTKPCFFLSFLFSHGPTALSFSFLFFFLFLSL